MASKKNKKPETIERPEPKELPVKDEEIAKLVQEYDEASSELDTRITNKKLGFDTFDKLYQVYIDKSKWPYSVALPNPRGFTSLYNKGVRMVGGRFTGTVQGNNPEDEMGAKIATEHFKWSVTRFNQFSDIPFEALAFQYDQNTRTYGAGFMRVLWKTVYKDVETTDGEIVRKPVYDNWWVEIINNRDLLLQPGRETMGKSDYVIYRRYASLEELENLQEDGASFDDSAMDVLREQKKGRGRNANYTSVAKTIKGIDDKDDRFEVCTTYYRNKWVTWCPMVGGDKKKNALILRSINNPYRHKDIPIVPLVYIPSQEEIYGMSELQPVASLLKILSALQSQFIELVNRELYPPVLVDPTRSRIDTFKYVPKAFWLVNDPNAVKQFEGSVSSLSKFETVYKMIVTEFIEAMGETGQGVSTVDLLGAGDKTATEVKDSAGLRNARDNFNKIMLKAALRKIMYLIFEMLRDPKFVDKVQVIKIVGREALEYFDKSGMGDWHINDEGYQKVIEYVDEISNNSNPEIKEAMEFEANRRGLGIFDVAYEMLLGSGELEQYMEPNNTVMTGEGQKVKYEKSDTENNMGYLRVDVGKDYVGDFDFSPDVEALNVPNTEDQFNARFRWFQIVTGLDEKGVLQKDGFKVKYKELLEKLGDLSNIKEAEQYFEESQEMGGVSNEAIQGGANQIGTGAVGQGLPGGGPVQPVPQAGPVNAAPEQIPGSNGPGMAGAI